MTDETATADTTVEIADKAAGIAAEIAGMIAEIDLTATEIETEISTVVIATEKGRGTEIIMTTDAEMREIGMAVIIREKDLPTDVKKNL